MTAYYPKGLKGMQKQKINSRLVTKIVRYSPYKLEVRMNTMETFRVIRKTNY